MGHLPLKCLFYETIEPDAISPLQDIIGPRPLWTLKPRDYEIPPESQYYRSDPDSNLLRSFYLLYIEANDPSEYGFAMETLGSWDHWLKLKECGFFQPYLKEMRSTLQAKMEYELVKAAQDIVQTGVGPQVLQAAKWLYESIKGPKIKSKRGRPSNEEIEGRLKQEAREVSEFNEDAKRLGIISNE